ncbi:MAG: hypothetical protein KJN96_09075, partial [Eudoraea sp.]|nr:hypothetical protein [Eudoraea sp.]
MKYFSFFFLALLLGCTPQADKEITVTTQYKDLLGLFRDWRIFETPPQLDGAPDYTAESFEKRHPEFLHLQNRLQAIDTSGWDIAKQVDWRLVWAEMNGYDFNYHVLKPWERDPAFYKTLWMARSDVPAHEGPTHHSTLELWTYTFPLDPTERTRLLKELQVIPVLNEQAQTNLTGNARDLWVAGIRDIENQSNNLQSMLDLPGVNSDQELAKAINEAIASTDTLANWLRSEIPFKDGPSGIGKENYSWYLRNVHLV